MANETMMTIVGNLTGDPELRFTPNGVALARFTVAATPRQYDKNSGTWKDGDALFLTCTAWRDLAENAAESLTRGTRVVVTGRLKLSRWETPEGEKRSSYGLDVDEVGPSLRFATATVRKMSRSSGTTNAPAEDPWATANPVDPSASSGDGFGDQPPF